MCTTRDEYEYAARIESMLCPCRGVNVSDAKFIFHHGDPQSTAVARCCDKCVAEVRAIYPALMVFEHGADAENDARAAFRFYEWHCRCGKPHAKRLHNARGIRAAITRRAAGERDQIGACASSACETGLRRLMWLSRSSLVLAGRMEPVDSGRSWD